MEICQVGGIFNNQFTVDLSGSLPVKKNYKSVKIWQNYGHEFVASLFGPPSTLKRYNVSEFWIKTFQKHRLKHDVNQSLSKHSKAISLFILLVG